MTKSLPASNPASSSRTPLLSALAALFFATLLMTAPARSAEGLEKLVAPIALYPDDLVAIILPASVNPLQLVQADRFLDKRKSNPKLPVDDKWDDSVKSLVNYPEVVKKMSGDLDWTTALGEAVVADQGEVLEAIQAFRRKAQAAGNLKSDGKQNVKVEKEVIQIVPADPQVIYVPQYNPSTVIVAGSPWGYYPSPYPVYYYPYAPGAAMAAGVIWGAAIGAAWSGNHYGYGGGNSININNSTNINRSGSASQRPAGGGSTAWKPNKQPGQVSGGLDRAPSNRVGDSRPGSSGSAGARPSTQPAGGSAASRDRSSGPSASTRDSPSRSSGGGAFDASSSGRQTSLDSSRGASSRSSMDSARSAPSRSSPSASTRSAPSRSGGGGRRR